ncbi:hypothetical protein SAMN05518672_10351 [Chitinophaga sp. CF118]|uniref:hypothetical protein n=1 Tax=Chitinophaga sp. CF118 TaxID=1884367 RepID=UPI0008DEAFC1|nr:hypothetical protein [Chitinophaga sp. CF118]SFD74894.1 hypothetical protein SAMN05518672_10351 [Chitinophaga sp. CF118]
MSNALPPSACQVFVIGFVDSSIVSSGQSTGLYFVDNRGNNGSSNEGTAKLNTASLKMDNVCWTVYPLNPNDGSKVSINVIGSSNAWGPTGQPTASTDGAYTGTTQNGGSAGYNILLNVLPQSGGGYQPQTTLGISVN